MFGQSSPKCSKYFHCVVSAHIFIGDDGRKDIELLGFIDDDHEATEIFCDIDHLLLEEIELGERKEHFFMAYVRSRFHSYYDYFDGLQGEVESEVIELKSIDDFAKIELS